MKRLEQQRRPGVGAAAFDLCASLAGCSSRFLSAEVPPFHTGSWVLVMALSVSGIGVSIV